MIFILGTDPQQCKELREILEERISDTVVTANSDGDLPNIKESNTVILTSEEKNTGILYRRLLNKASWPFGPPPTMKILDVAVGTATSKRGGLTGFGLVGVFASSKNQQLAGHFREKLEEQVHRAELLGELIRLFSSSLQIDELLDRVVSKSAEVLGDTSFIVLSGDTGQIKLEAAFSKDRDRLLKMLITTVNLGGQALNGELLNDVLVRRQPLIIQNLQQANIDGEMKVFAEKYSVASLLAVPIQTKEVVLGAFVSIATEPHVLTAEDAATASALADFTAIALENAGLFAELQRSAITDPLTGSYNTRFFHEVLGRERARAGRYHRGSHFETLVAEADQALYASKRSSKNCARAFKAGDR